MSSFNNGVTITGIFPRPTVQMTLSAAHIVTKVSYGLLIHAASCSLNQSVFRVLLLSTEALVMTPKNDPVLPFFGLSEQS